MRTICYGELIPGKTYYYYAPLSRFEEYYFLGDFAVYRRDIDTAVSYDPSCAERTQEVWDAAAYLETDLFGASHPFDAARLLVKRAGSGS
mgnify:CR=1 FL=1